MQTVIRPKFKCSSMSWDPIYSRIVLYKLLPATAKFFSPVALRSNAGHGLLILEVSRSHTATHHSRQDSSGRVISASQRPLPDKTQHSQQTDFHASGGIRTHDLSRRAAVNLRLRPRGHWDWHYSYQSPLFELIKYKIVVFDEVNISFHFNIILKHKGVPSTKIVGVRVLLQQLCCVHD